VLSACPDCAAGVLENPAADRALEGSSLETIRHMVASGMGVTVLPCTAVGVDRYGAELLATRPFAAPEPRRRVALAWRQSFPRRAAVAELARAIGRCDLACVQPVRGELAALA
jgi:LysR family hydrogen peroxide-inducible transcriptional activator